MDITEISKGDTRRTFDLPERQSKINTILKMQNEAPLYCICRSSSNNDSFMIQCEKCEEWFHGDCIGLKQKDVNSIRKWFCFMCIQHHGLKIVFRNPKTSMKKKIKEKKQKLFNKMIYQDNENAACGKCSNCLQNEECGNRNFNFKHLKHNSERVAKQSQIVRKPFVDLKNCYNNGCYRSRRISSKYCSDECGLALAKQRLMTILPQRIAEWEKIPCMADQFDKSKLDIIRMQQKLSTEKLKILDNKEQELRTLIDRTKKIPIVENISECEDTKMFCLTCGWEIPVRVAVKHMELCYKKHESQFEVVGKIQSNTSYCHIFCDFFDTKKRTYCKHLRYICPDHFKPMKAPESEVCGCPIVETISSNMFSNSKIFCQQAKQNCDQHYNWEYTALSEIDFERLKEFNKMNQLVEEEAIIVQRLKNRLGALGLLHHSTSISE